MASNFVSSRGVTRSSEVKHLLILFFLALAVRFIFVVFYQGLPHDAIGYDMLARNLLAGNGFSWEPAPPYHPNLFRTPVYPVFLAIIYKLFGFHDTIVYVVQALIGSATCSVVYLIARRYWDRRLALLASLLNATYLYAAYHVSVKLTETLFTFLMCCAIYIVVLGSQKQSWRLMAVAGAVMGVAILCRPEALLFPLLLLPLFLVLHRFRAPWLKMGMALVVSAFLIVLPWSIRNYYVSGKTVALVSHGPGLIFWQTTLPYFSWSTFAYGPGSEQDPLVRALTKGHLSYREVADLEPTLWRTGFQNILRDPKSYLKRRVREYPHFWISSGDYLLGKYNLSFGEAVAQKRYGLILAKISLLLITGLAPLILAFIGFLVTRRRFIELFPLWAMTLYVATFRLPFDYTPRYTLPLHPYLLMFAACGALYLWNRFVKRPALQSSD